MGLSLNEAWPYANTESPCLLGCSEMIWGTFLERLDFLSLPKADPAPQCGEPGLGGGQRMLKFQELTGPQGLSCQGLSHRSQAEPVRSGGIRSTPTHP